MAYTMAHVWAAEKALKYIPEIKEHSAYILGTIAPDAVHANPDYTKELKEKSHLFTENLKWGMIGSWAEAEEWLDNIKKIYRENRMAYDQDFLLGYIVHLFVDVYNSLYFYGSFMESIKCDHEETLARNKKEAFGINYYLFSLYAREKDPRKILDSGKAVTFNGIIDKKDILKRIDDLFQYEFRNQDISDINEYKICTIEGTERLIEDAIRADGTVKQGQEYGVFTESGLRVAVVAVRKGEYFEAGTPLFQVDTADLQRIIDIKELEIEKQKSVQKEHLLEEQKTDREQRTAETRSREDYDNVVSEADAQIEKCRQALDAARQELELYDQYISLLSQVENTVSSGDAETVAADSGNSSGPNIDGSTPEQQYNRQEKRYQLVQNVISCSQALEDAERSKEIALQAASRVIEDAGRDLTGSSSAAVEGLDIAYQEKEMLRLKELMDRDGWIYSESAGRVTDCRVVVGERTQDGAGIGIACFLNRFHALRQL